MWFRPRSQHNESDRFRVPSIRSRSKKSASKCIDADGKESNTAKSNSVATSNGATLPLTVGRQHVVLNCDDDSTKEKNKVIKIDQKYKKNRVSKSSSRTKVHDLKAEKPISNKCANNSSCCNNQRKSSTQLVEPIVLPKKPSRRNTTLNLNALLRYKSFISGSTKKLTHDDFERLRRKSLGETGTIRRKSSTESNKKKTDAKKETRTTNKEYIDHDDYAYESSNDDVFQSCNEDDHKDGALKSAISHPNSKSNKKSRSKSDKKGLTHFVQFLLI